MSRMPMKEAPCRLVLSKALLMRWTSQRNRRSYVALAKASTAKSAWRESGKSNGETIKGDTKLPKMSVRVQAGRLSQFYSDMLPDYRKEIYSTLDKWTCISWQYIMLHMFSESDMLLSKTVGRRTVSIEL